MKCPLFTMAEIAHEPELNPSQNTCLETDCAWWVEDRDRCSIKLLAMEMGYTSLFLYDLKERLHRGLPK